VEREGKGKGRREIREQLRFGSSRSSFGDAADLRFKLVESESRVNPGVIAAQSQISTLEWDNGDAWDARDTIFCPVESTSWKVRLGHAGEGGRRKARGR